MSMQVRVEALKQQLEQLFPGTCLSAKKGSRNSISTGIDGIDSGLSRGIARKRISEWSGPLSSGKTTLLRNAISHCCTQGLNVAYIDCQGKLYPADWASIEGGKFWIIRPEEKNEAGTKETSVLPLVSRKNMYVQEALWSADQFIRSNAFDLVILDLGNNDLSKRKNLGMGYSSLPSKIYARLSRALAKSKAALLIVSDTEIPESENEPDSKRAATASGNWGCHTRFLFNRGLAIRAESGLKGLAMIIPTVKLTVLRDGQLQEVEVSLGSSVPNRLFTHPQVPDRRTSKA